MSKKDFNPFEMVLHIAEMARENEWKEKQEVLNEEESIKKIINRPSEIKNYPYEAYLEFLNKKDDDLS